ncbi:alpha/beta hydrolase family protein [Streptomyces iconiensis]|uniref:Alpha/beta fold hydrolase n=1 Tax=Streptomyces iconiensis TaxID=1384038 RepID=A0ABT7A3I4_9ACTN|nr:alpha/beta fold hydrolase [Streptomyces iconiensis]MDJ1135869.1 alpha/beta fold hydrolase [Streptomyces iconiensis]
MSNRAVCDLARPPHAFVTERGRHGAVRRELRTADGVRIEALYEPYAGPVEPASGSAGQGGGPGGTPGAIVLAHGFTGALDRPALRRAATAFTEYAAVVTFSFRGHGGSGGRSTVGDLEVLDLAAAVEWARSLGHERVATAGFSMGGSVVLRHGALFRPEGAGSHEGSPAQRHAASESAFLAHRGRAGSHASASSDAVIAVSAPARWYYRGTAPMRRLHWAVQRPLGRVVARYGLRTRVQAGDWDPVPLSPVGAVPHIAPAPLLVVHGDRDPYFPLDHPRSLAAAASREACELWIVPGFGHAENAAEMALLHRIGGWARERAAESATARSQAPGARRHHGSRDAQGPREAERTENTEGTEGTDG